MRIDALSIHPIRIPRKQIFEIAMGKSSHVEQVIVSVLGEGLEGWGAGSANSVTGEGLQDMIEAVERGFDSISGKDSDPRGFDRVLEEQMRGHPAAMCAISLALWDLAGKVEGKGIAEILGLAKTEMLSDMSIGLCSLDETVLRAGEAVAQGFRALKVKVGGQPLWDARRVAAVRKAHPDIALWVDGNRGYSKAELGRFVKGIRGLDVTFIEEPCATLQEARSIRKQVRLMADESATDSSAIATIIKKKSADMINIKLMKCGTLSDAILSSEIMENHNVKGMIGCMGETSLSMAGALAVALASRSIVLSDLDSSFMLKEDICTGLRFEEGFYKYTGLPGLGVQVDQKKVLEYEVELRA